MPSKYDLLLDDLAEWVVEHRRRITSPDLEPIARKHLGMADDLQQEVDQFTRFLQTPKGSEAFRIAIRSHLASEQLEVPK